MNNYKEALKVSTYVHLEEFGITSVNDGNTFIFPCQPHYVDLQQVEIQ